jgi:dGTPase
VNALAHRAPAPHPPGLNLTPATLNAILKYPWFRELDPDDSSKPAMEVDPASGTKTLKTKKARKFGAYRLERDQFNAARALFPSAGSDLKSPEAEIMDWADDLTFAVHDAEDFYRAGLVPLDRLSLDDEAERKHFFDGITGRPELLRMIGGSLTSDYTEAFYRVIIGFPLDEKYVGSASQRSSLRNFMSALIGQYIDAFELVEPKNLGDPFIAIHPSSERQVKMLKLLTWHYVILNPSLATQQYGQRKIIRSLVEILHEAATKGNEDVFPLAFTDQVRTARGDAALTTRVIADLISGMTERQVVELHHRLTGTKLGSIFDSLL